jgi:excisionase family DNA binding protein
MSNANEALLTPEEAKDRLRYTNVASVYRLVNDGKISHIRRGRNILLRQSAIDEFLKSQEQIATAEKEKAA